MNQLNVVHIGLNEMQCFKLRKWFELCYTRAYVANARQ